MSESSAVATHGMVAASQPLAVDIGLEVLRSGGTAVDAAIATNAALGLMEPFSCGVGGDAFALVWDAESQALFGLNGSGRSPRTLTYQKLAAEVRDLGCDAIPERGPLSISVPGAVDAWFTLHKRFGRMPIAELLSPTIEYCLAGFNVTPVISSEWGKLVSQVPASSADRFRSLYCRDGTAPSCGQVFVNADLASTHRAIADGGREEFYSGDIAVRIAKCVQECGGHLTVSDLQVHRSEWVKPVSVNYRGYDVCELPPNCQGIAALQILKILEGFDLASVGGNSAQAVHYMVEAKKLVFEDRAHWYADPATFQAPVDVLLSAEYAATRRGLIGERASKVVETGLGRHPNADTVYLATADARGNMVSFIQSLYLGFGSGVVVPELGFALQNRGSSFSMDQRHPNVYSPAKRPFHTIMPGFALRAGCPWLSFGVMGADMQPQGHVQILTNMIDFGMDPESAGAAARWRHNGSTSPTAQYDAVLSDGGVLHLEGALAAAVESDLAGRGHVIGDGVQSFGGYQAIMRDPDGVYHGGSDPRKDGKAAGY